MGGVSEVGWLDGSWDGPRFSLGVGCVLSAVELPTRWALNEALRRDSGGWPYRAYGHVVLPGVPRVGFGRGVAGQSRLTHACRSIALAWLGGRLMGAMAVWVCGRRSPRFELLAEPVGVVCGVCALGVGLVVTAPGPAGVGRME